jgi:hypothetical protein
MTKEQYNKVKEQYLADKESPPKKKSFNSFFKFGKRQAMNKSLKKADQVLIFLINLKKQIEGPLLVKVYGGNFFVIRNHVYRFNPENVLSFGKYKAGIAREFDRNMIGIADYENLVLEDWLSKNPGTKVNIDDPVLIKALIQAKLSEKTPMKAGMKWIIIAVVIIGLIVGFFLLTSKKAAPAATVTPTK